MMAGAVFAIFLAGMLTVGAMKGWFGSQAGLAVTQPDGTRVTLDVTADHKTGSASIVRNGVAYGLKDGNALRDGDRIETGNGSSITIVYADNAISLDENSRVTVRMAQEEGLSLDLENGGIFAVLSLPLRMNVMEQTVTAEAAVFSANAPSGSGNIYVYGGTVTLGETRLAAGTAGRILSDGVHSAAFSLQQLNHFDLTHLATVSTGQSLCYTKADVEKLEADRLAALEEAQKAQMLADQNAQQVDDQRQDGQTPSSGSGTGSGSTSSGGTASGGASSGGTASGGTSGPTCTIEIRCDTILNNLGDLTPGKDKYVPTNGTILTASKLTFEEGETVFDVLKRACKTAGIQLEYSWTPMYNSYYIEGIHQLYEFDCGNESGWMYQVNGWFPNYGCSAYNLKDGDVIVWQYTCKGLGADVGGGV